MDAPPPREDVGPFVRIARHLGQLGFSAPAIVECDEQQGFLIIEDFGDDTYTRLLASGADETALYTLALDTLCKLHTTARASAIELAAYDEGVLINEALLLLDWYMPYSGGPQVDEALRSSFAGAWRDVLNALALPHTTLVLRDFHVDNLMQLPQRSGIAACGLLDFQDALIGPAPYDVVSLLQDARRDLSPTLVTEMLTRYRDRLQLNEADMALFMSWYRVLGAQRHTKVLGIFVRLHRRDGKEAYLRHLPRLRRLLQQQLQAPELRPVASWFRQHLPHLL